MTGPSRIGILGGTFDPPQNGHIDVARSVADKLGLDTVLFVPAGDPWHKNEQASAEDRLAMVQRAIAGIDRISLETVDIDRGGPTYTVDTLRDLQTKYPHHELYFILGDEAFAKILSWKDAEQLGSLAQFVVVSRDGLDVEVPSFLASRVNLLEIPTLPISSTICRERIRSGDSLENLVPARVAEYIEEHQLYRSGV